MSMMTSIYVVNRLKNNVAIGKSPIICRTKKEVLAEVDNEILKFDSMYSIEFRLWLSDPNSKKPNLSFRLNGYTLEISFQAFEAFESEDEDDSGDVDIDDKSEKTLR